MATIEPWPWPTYPNYYDNYYQWSPNITYPPQPIEQRVRFIEYYEDGTVKKIEYY